jgi:hypothetical protein
MPPEHKHAANPVETMKPKRDVPLSEMREAFYFLGFK